MMIKNKKRKYPNFQLDWNFYDKDALIKTTTVVRKWIRKHEADNTTNNMRVRDIFTEIAPEVYNQFTNGDKKRIGKAFSKMYNKGYYPELRRGKKNGATNTYHL